MYSFLLLTTRPPLNRKEAHLDKAFFPDAELLIRLEMDMLSSLRFSVHVHSPNVALRGLLTFWPVRNRQPSLFPFFWMLLLFYTSWHHLSCLLLRRWVIIALLSVQIAHCSLRVQD